MKKKKKNNMQKNYLCVSTHKMHRFDYWLNCDIIHHSCGFIRARVWEKQTYGIICNHNSQSVNILVIVCWWVMNEPNIPAYGGMIYLFPSITSKCSINFLFVMDIEWTAYNRPTHPRPWFTVNRHRDFHYDFNICIGKKRIRQFWFYAK